MTTSFYMEKAMPHYNMSQWLSNNNNLEMISNRRQQVSNDVRQKAIQLQNATENTMKWKLNDSNSRMQERITEVDQWYDQLEFTLTDVKDQIQRLSEAKVALESCLADLLPLQEAAKEVILLRDRRRGIDLVEDEPYYNVKKELKMIDKAGDEFRRLAHDAWLQLVNLKCERDKLVADLARKEHTMAIDKYKLSLTPESRDRISYKLNPTELPADTVDPATWLRNCIQLKKDAESCLVKAMQLTNDIWGILKRNIDIIKNQREVTQRSLRKRHHDIRQARDKLGGERSDLMDEIDQVEKEMKNTEKAIADKTGNLQLAETRLENRKWRRGMELVQDEPYENIKDELFHGRKSKQVLEDHLRDIKNNLNCLRHQLRRVEEDLEQKERSLAIESFCLEGHERPVRAPYQMDLAWRAPTTSLTFSALTGMEVVPDTTDQIDFKELAIATTEQATMTDPTDGVEYVLE